MFPSITSVQNELLLSTVFLAGFLSFFSPCTFPVLPVYIGILTDYGNDYKKIKILNKELNVGSMISTISFVLGITTSFLMLGFGVGVLSKFLRSGIVIVVAGIIVAILGIHQMEIIKIKKIDNIKGLNIQNNKTKALGAYIMGLSFSLSFSPCVAPVLGSILILSATSSSSLYAIFLMLIYSLGLMIPFIFISIFSNIIISKMGNITKYLGTIKKIGGVVIFITGLVIIYSGIGKL